MSKKAFVEHLNKIKPQLGSSVSPIKGTSNIMGQTVTMDSSLKDKLFAGRSNSTAPIKAPVHLMKDHLKN